MSAYDVIYLLKPQKEVEPGWWKLKWRFIWRETVSLFWNKNYSGWSIGIGYWNNDATNGWGRSFKHRFFELFLFKWSLRGWIRWDFVVMKQGPLDMESRRPLVLP